VHYCLKFKGPGYFSILAALWVFASCGSKIVMREEPAVSIGSCYCSKPFADSLTAKILVTDYGLKVSGDCFPAFRMVYPGLKNYSLKIYNRWGQMMFESGHPSKNWLCRDSCNSIILDGVYVGMLKLVNNRTPADTLTRHFTLTVIR
jgi:hypothetical protein